MHCHRVLKFTQDVAAFPWVGQRAIFTGVQCSVVLVFLPWSLHTGRSDVVSWLGQGNHALLKACTCVVLGPGDHAYMPASYRVCVVGLPTDAGTGESLIAQKGKHLKLTTDDPSLYVAFSVSLAFAVNRDVEALSKEEAFWVQAEYGHNLRHIPNSIRRAVGDSSWKKRLEDYGLPEKQEEAKEEPALGSQEKPEAKQEEAKQEEALGAKDGADAGASEE
jgi:hypothetical protein